MFLHYSSYVPKRVIEPNVFFLSWPGFTFLVFQVSTCGSVPRTTPAAPARWRRRWPSRVRGTSSNLSKRTASSFWLLLPRGTASLMVRLRGLLLILFNGNTWNHSGCIRREKPHTASPRLTLGMYERVMMTDSWLKTYAASSSAQFFSDGQISEAQNWLCKLKAQECIHIAERLARFLFMFNQHSRAAEMKEVHPQF